MWIVRSLPTWLWLAGAGFAIGAMIALSCPEATPHAGEQSWAGSQCPPLFHASEAYLERRGMEYGDAPFRHGRVTVPRPSDCASASACRPPSEPVCWEH